MIIRLAKFTAFSNMRLESIFWLVLLAILEYVSAFDTENMSQEALKQVETSLMSMFGFKGRPKIDKSKIVIPQEMIDMYERQMGFPLDTTSIPKRGLHTMTANTVRSFTHSESLVDERFPNHHKFRLKFNITSVPTEEQLKAAEVKLKRITLDHLPEDERYQRISVNDIVRPGRKGNDSPIIRLIDTKIVDTHKQGSISIDVFPAVQRWIENPKGNHGLLITVAGKNKKSNRHIRIRRHVDDTEMEWRQAQPILYTYTDDGKNKHKTKEEMATLRRKRSHKRKNYRDKVSPCKRHKMYVNFTSVGWNDWIVAPPGYDAYFCQGACDFPIPDHLNATNHAIVQTIFNSMRPQVVPRVCCVPTQLTTISMLYVDDNSKIVLKNYKEMVVIGCGCR